MKNNFPFFLTVCFFVFFLYFSYQSLEHNDDIDQGPLLRMARKDLMITRGARQTPDPFLLKDLMITSNPRQTPDPFLLKDQVDVSLTLAKHLLLNYSKDSNIVFSPISIQVVLSLIAAGSSGQTLDQLLLFLKAKTTDDLNNLYSHLVDFVFANSSSGGPSLSFANGLWFDKSLSIKPPFKQVVETMYKAASQQVDFKNKAEEGRNIVNSWVDKKTNAHIKDILPPNSVDRDTSLVLANALYFKGEWSSEFDAYNTKDYDFHILNGDSVQVPFMTSDSERYISAFDGFKVLRLPYKRGWNQDSNDPSFAMYIILPDANDGLPALVEKIGSKSEFLDRDIRYQEVTHGAFLIPKFKFEYQVEASKVLNSLGLVLPFDRHVLGLGEMVYGTGLHVSNIFQKSFIEVNEKGTEAAAATAADADNSFHSGKVVIDFVANHPFLFVIKEDVTGIVQFMGQVLNPSTT